MTRVFRSKLAAIRHILGARAFVIATERMCMAAVVGKSETVMVAAQLEAQAHILRGDMSQRELDYTDEVRDQIRVRLVQSTIKEEDD